MKATWAVQLSSSSTGAALPLRSHRTVEIWRQGGDVYLRGEGEWEQIEALAKQIPDAIHYRVLEDGQLVRVGRFIPEGRLPEGPWERFASVCELRPGVAAMPGTLARRTPIRIVRLDNEQTAGALLTSTAAWAAYASDAPQVRLNVLRFAAAADRRVLIVGNPLPPIPGEYLMEREGLAVPCGFAWEPALQPSIVRRVLGLADGDMALLRVDASYEIIRGGSLVRASRSAARHTLARFESETIER